MPRRAGSLGQPAEFVSGAFPNGKVVADAPVGVVEMVGVARRLRDHLDSTGTSVSELARSAGVNRTTIHDVMAGRSYMDVVTLARLEATTGQRLWGAEDR